MPAPKTGVSISSSSLLILNGPFQVGNGTGDPGMLQKIQVGGISGKCIGEGCSQHRKVEKNWENTSGIQRKVGLQRGKEQQVHGQNSKEKLGCRGGRSSRFMEFMARIPSGNTSPA